MEKINLHSHECDCGNPMEPGARACSDCRDDFAAMKKRVRRMDDTAMDLFGEYLQSVVPGDFCSCFLDDDPYGVEIDSSISDGDAGRCPECGGILLTPAEWLDIERCFNLLFPEYATTLFNPRRTVIDFGDYVASKRKGGVDVSDLYTDDGYNAAGSSAGYAEILFRMERLDEDLRKLRKKRKSGKRGKKNDRRRLKRLETQQEQIILYLQAVALQHGQPKKFPSWLQNAASKIVPMFFGYAFDTLRRKSQRNVQILPAKNHAQMYITDGKK